MSELDFYTDSIEVSKIQRNPDNPRGKNVRDNDDEFEYLKRSIKEFGLIVPIIVRKKDNDGYVLLDGERRYLALKELGIKEAPAHVLSSKINESVAKDIMFHIHTTRAPWDAFQHCRALESLYMELKKKFDGDETLIARELVKRTGAHIRTINNRLDFLRWPEKIKNFVYNERNELYWTVVEIEIGIIRPAKSNFPRYFEKVPEDEVRELLLDKYVEGHVHAATEVRKARTIARTTEENKEQHRYALKILARLIRKVDYTFEDARADFLAKYPGAEETSQKSRRKLLRQVLTLCSALSEYDLSLFRSAPDREKRELVVALEELLGVLQNLKDEEADIFSGA